MVATLYGRCGNSWRTGVTSVYNRVGFFGGGWLELGPAVHRPARWDFTSSADGFSSKAAGFNLSAPHAGATVRGGHIVSNPSGPPALLGGTAQLTSPSEGPLGTGQFRFRAAISVHAVSGSGSSGTFDFYENAAQKTTIPFGPGGLGWRQVTTPWFTKPSGSMRSDFASLHMFLKQKYSLMGGGNGTTSWVIECDWVLIEDRAGHVVQMEIKPERKGHAWCGGRWVEFY